MSRSSRAHTHNRRGGRISSDDRYWIQRAIKRPGRVRRYMASQYGARAFTSRGTIRREYLDRAITNLERSGRNPNLLRALRLAKKLHSLR